jgi:phage terminase large subunit-like protein
MPQARADHTTQKDDLSPEQALSGWYDFSVDKLGYSKSKTEWLKYRDRGRRDLFWLAKHCLKLDLVDSFVCPNHPIITGPEATACSICEQIMEPCPGIPPGTSFHRQLCDTFVKKNPDETIFNQDAKKTRLILCPRGSFKSSCDRADCAQWIICFPNIRIVIFSASPDLGCAFVTSVKDWFTLAFVDKDKDTYQCNKEFELFQQLYPEHLVGPGRRESEDQFTTPARNKKMVEASIFTLPLEGSSSGFHADVGKFDDCVSDGNSGAKSTKEQRETVRKNLSVRRKLILLSGYRDYVGTPYADDDAYSHMLEYQPPEVVLIRPARELKPSSKTKRKSEISKDDYYLLLPIDSKGEPQLTYEALQKEENDDEYIFACQYLCNPQKAHSVIFTEQMFESHIVPTEGLPQDGTYKTFSAWDLASSDGKGSDYSVGVVGYITVAGPLVGRAFIREIIRGRFNKAELPYQIAYQAAKWKVERIGIEKSQGAEWLESDIMRQLIACGYSDCPVPDWIPVDTSKNAKEFRAECVAILLNEDRLYFSAEIPIMADVSKEFIRFKPHSKRKDDIVDAVAHFTRYLPAHIELPKNEQERQQRADEWLKQKQMHDRIYPGMPEPVIPPPQAPTSYEGLPVFANWEQQLGYGT